jgi:hypothetical protein
MPRKFITREQLRRSVAGELTEVLHQVRLIVIAAFNRRLRPVPARFENLKDMRKALNATEELRREADSSEEAPLELTGAHIENRRRSRKHRNRRFLKGSGARCAITFAGRHPNAVDQVLRGSG